MNPGPTTRTIAGFTGILTKLDDGTYVFEHAAGDGGAFFRLAGDLEGIYELAWERASAEKKRRRPAWPENGAEAMAALALLFPTFHARQDELEAIGISPWNVERLIAWLNGPAPGSGAAAAGRFLLGVWNNSTDWTEHGLAAPGRFDVFEGMASWDTGHREAFLTWCRTPFWP